MQAYDYDFIIIGSGFGGSVAALRLTEKGYKVAVIEAGKRFDRHDFAKTSWNIKRFLWCPTLKCHGILRINFFKHVDVLAGCGVGGGSLVYANTLYQPKNIVWQNGSWASLQDWQTHLAPHYQTAKTMLGAAKVPQPAPADIALKQAADAFGVGQHYELTTTAVYFGDGSGKTVPDPYFNGEGPGRQSCTQCGACMVGCRDGGKNTLDKNYLYFAEKNGAEVFPETLVTELAPIDAKGKQGYFVSTQSSSNWIKKNKRQFRAKAVIIAAGVLGTMKLLLHCQAKGLLPNLSAQLGKHILTNSESLIGVRKSGKHIDFSKGVAIGSSCHIDEHTHVQAVRYPKGSDALGLLGTVMPKKGNTAWQRRMSWFFVALRHPLRALHCLVPFGFARTAIILLVMQTTDAKLNFKLKRSWLNPWKKTLGTTGDRIPAYIPKANEFNETLAKVINAVPMCSINEVLFNKPITAHILGGARIAANAGEGVVDKQQRVFNYENLMICDGSVIAANLGVNPSLTITALTEHAMGYIFDKNCRPV